MLKSANKYLKEIIINHNERFEVNYAQNEQIIEKSQKQNRNFSIK